MPGLHPRRAAIETFLSSALVADVDRACRTIRSPAGRAVGGASGGYCALNLGLRHQLVFGAILAMMPYGDPGRNAVDLMLGGSAALGRANSPSDYVRTMLMRRLQSVFLATGRHDTDTYRTVQLMASVVGEPGDYVGVRINPGLGHNWREARYSCRTRSRSPRPASPRRRPRPADLPSAAPSRRRADEASSFAPSTLTAGGTRWMTADRWSGHRVSCPGGVR